MQKLKIRKNTVAIPYSVLNSSKFIVSTKLNYRTDFEEKDANTETIKNNKDSKDLISDFTKRGYNLNEKSMKVMPLTSFMFGYSAKKYLNEQIKKDKKLAKAVEWLENAYRTFQYEKNIEKAYKQKGFDEYYVLLGGFTRYAIMTTCFDGYDGTINCELVTREDFSGFNNYNDYGKENSQEDVIAIRKCFEIYTQLVIINDNAETYNITESDNTTRRQAHLAELICDKFVVEKFIANSNCNPRFANCPKKMIEYWVDKYSTCAKRAKNIISAQLYKAILSHNQSKTNSNDNNIKFMSKAQYILTSGTKRDVEFRDFLGTDEVGNIISPKKYHKAQEVIKNLKGSGDVSYATTVLKACKSSGKELTVANIKAAEKDVDKKNKRKEETTKNILTKEYDAFDLPKNKKEPFINKCISKMVKENIL